MKNTFLRDFGLEVPIVQGAMGGASGPELVAAVSNTGALGILPIWSLSPGAAKSQIRETKLLTDRPIAVNVRADLLQLDHISIALEEGVSIIHVFWGDPSETAPVISAGGAKMIVTVGDAKAAEIALAAGASALIAQGVEAGGHVLGDTPTLELLPAVLAMAGDIPVIAAGGCADAEDAKRLMAMGASAVLVGTRFAASTESSAHPDYKRAIIEAGEGATARSLCFDKYWPDAPHRTLINSTFKMWDEAGRPPMGIRPGESDIVLKSAEGRDIPRYAVSTPMQGMSGDILAGAMYAGTGCARISDCPSAAEIIERINCEL